MADMLSSLHTVMQLRGIIAVAVVDADSGIALGHAGDEDCNIVIASAGDAEVLRAKLNLIKALRCNTYIEDIIITLDQQYHIIRPMRGKEGAGLFLYVILERSQANLSLSRRTIADVEQTFYLY